MKFLEAFAQGWVLDGDAEPLRFRYDITKPAEEALRGQPYSFVNTQLMPTLQVGEGVCVVNSFLLGYSKLGSDISIKDSYLSYRNRIGSHTTLENVVTGGDVQVGPGSNLSGMTLINRGVVIPPHTVAHEAIVPSSETVATLCAFGSFLGAVTIHGHASGEPRFSLGNLRSADWSSLERDLQVHQTEFLPVFEQLGIFVQQAYDSSYEAVEKMRMVADTRLHEMRQVIDK